MAGWGRMGRDPAITIVTQFVTAVTWSYVYVFLPFYIQHISPYDREETLLWTGVIMGISGLSAALAAPSWGAMAGRWSPRMLLRLGIAVQGLLIAGMAFIHSLPGLFVVRLLIGTTGGLSTIGMVVLSATVSPARLPELMGFFQASLTLGHIVGPLVGALSADLMGFRAAFLAGGGAMAAAYALCRWGMTPLPPFAPPPGGEPVRGRRLLAGWLLCFAASLQITFMPSVLPELMGALAVPAGRAVRVAGLIVFSYGAASMLGAYLAGRAAARWGERPALAGAAVGASALLPLLAFPDGVAAFAAIRFLQAGLIAGAIPIVFAQVASASPGRTIGLINTSRFAAFALGPFVATWFFAHASPLALYLVLSAFTLAVLPGLRPSPGPARHPAAGAGGRAGGGPAPSPRWGKGLDGGGRRG